MQRVDYAALADEYARHRSVHPDVLSRLVDGLDRAMQVLEVGCGTGNYVCELQRLVGCACTGIDPSKQMLEKLRSRGGLVQIRECPAERLAVASDSFDLAFSVDVLHHIGDRPGAFREAFRVLRADGRICSVTDSEWIIRNREPLSSYFPETVTVDLGRYPTISAVRLEMKSAGFDSIREELVELAYDLHEADAYRNKVFSSLLFLEPDAFERGLTRLEADLRRGPIPCNSRYLLLWGSKSPTTTDRAADASA